MAQIELTDSSIKTLVPPSKGYTTTYDSKLRGFAVRTYDTGAQSWVLNYSAPSGSGRPWYTIGTCSAVKAARARAIAKNLKERIRVEGYDPSLEQQEAREMLTVSEALPLHLDESVAEDLIGASTRKDYDNAARLDVYPLLGNKKLDAVTTTDVSKLFTRITARGSKRRANYVVALVRALYNRALTKWKLKLPDGNPCNGVTKHPEFRRDDRHLLPQQVQPLAKAMAKHPDQQAMAIIRFLLETGARRGEISGARWQEIDYDTNELAKPRPKQKKPHRIALSANAMALVRQLRQQADAELARINGELKNAEGPDADRLEQWRERVETYLFPSPTGQTGHRLEIRDQWHDLCVSAGLTVTERVQGKDGKTRMVVKHAKRLHDLRHTVGATAVNNGVDIYTLQKMFGHASVATTQRYANVTTETKARGAALISAALNGGAKVLPMRKNRA